MRKEEIIAKGAYTAPQFGELISVRQFIMLREKGEKHLLLRLRNDRAERADAVSFRVKQFDIKGNLIGAETVTERNIAAEGGQEFAPDTPVKLNHACVDFTVEMVSAVYGDYTYHLHGDTLTSSYESRSEEPPLDKEAIAKSLRGRSGRVTVKTTHAPRLLVASVAIILLVVAVFAFLQLKNFMATEEFFTLESVDYRFLTDDHENGPISIVGYRGNAGNIIIPADVEGHEVAEIADRAFEGKVLRSVTIKGSPAIGERAFADCKYLDKVEIPNVTEIGYAAFAGCGELKELALSSSLTAIPVAAFEGCRSLTEVHLPEGLVSLDSGAFRGCSSLTTVTLPNTLTHMGVEVFADCTALTSLTAPYAGMNEAGRDTVGYLFGGSDRIPHTLTSITVTKATAIGSYAFGGCSSVEEVSLPDSVKSIGYGAFDGCTKLTSLRLPAGLTQLGCDAFRNCISLRSVAIPAGVRTLPAGTFADCTGLQTVTLPDGLEQIETDAFANCTSLTLLDIPESVKLLQSNALGGCTGLETLTIPFLGESADAPMPLSGLFGAPLHGLKTLTVRNTTEIVDMAFQGFDGLQSVTLQGTATRVGSRAFEKCTSLQSVTLPDTVTDMGEYAFAECISLPAVVLPAELTEISEGVFAGCSSLKRIDAPAGLRTLGNRAFAGCSSLEDISWLRDVTDMGEYVFDSCTSLKEATLPTAMTAIQDGTFNACSGLQTVTLSPATEVIGRRAFGGCSALSNVSIPEQTREILEEAFADCSSLTAVSLPSTLQLLGQSAYAGCSSMVDLTVPAGIVEMGESILAGCTSLKTLSVPYIGRSRDNAAELAYLMGSDIPESLRSVQVTHALTLANDTFNNCSGIESIQLASGLTAIGENAFRNCAALDSLIIPETVTEIGAYAFSGCRGLKEILIPQTVTLLQKGILAGCDSLTKVTVPFIGESRSTPSPLTHLFYGASIPSSLTSVTLTDADALDNYTFENCSRLTTITLNKDLKTIGAYAFYNCRGLQTLTIPSTVTRIENNAFDGCTGLKKITIPSSVTSIGANALLNCRSLTEVNIPFVGTSRYDSSAFATLFGGHKDIPVSLTKVTVTNSTTVKDNAFNGMSSLKEIVYTQTVTDIGVSAFNGCSSLTSFAFSDGLVSIGERAFYNCDGLTELVLPEGIDSIGERAFYDCSNLTSSTVGSTATSIGQYAFGQCNNLTELTVPFVGGTPYDGNSLSYVFGNQWNIPQSLRRVTVTNSSTVKDNAFSGMSNLEEVVYEQAITAIGAGAFYNCSSLAAFDIPDTVIFVGNEAFYNCDSLTGVHLSGGDVTLGSNAFYDCDGIIELNATDGTVNIGSQAFANCDNLTTLNVSGGSVTIGYESFYNCDGLTELVLPEGIDSIGGRAFYDCNNLTSATVGSTATSIGQYAFGQCNNLTELTVPFVGGTPYDGNSLSYVFGNQWNMPQGLRRVTVTNSTTVKDNAFNGMSNLEEIVYEQPVTAIGVSAFNGCSSLTSFAFSDGLVSIGERAFYNCDGLTELVLPEGIDSIGERAFYDCSNLTSSTVGSTATSIGQYAFGQCNNLTELTVPFVGGTPYDGNSLSYVFGNQWNMPQGLRRVTVTNSTTVKDNAFNGMSNLEEIVYEQPITAIGASAFYNCSSLAAFDIPDTVISIGSHAFYGCSSLNEIHVPEGVESFGEYAFYNCNGISELTFAAESVDIGSHAFANCDNLTTLNVSDGSVTIGYEAFFSCDGLTELVLPDGIESIGESAFYNCNGLTSMTVNDTVSSIGYNAFGQCNNLTELSVPFVGGTPDDGNRLSYVFGDQWNMPRSLRKVTVTDSTTVKPYAFQSLQYVEEIVYTQNVTEIGNNAFESCTALKRVELGDAIETIGSYSFSNCYALKSFTIPAGCQSVGDYAFAWCYALYEVYNDSELTFAEWDMTYLRNNCLAYRTDDTPVEKVSVDGVELLLADNGTWYVVNYTGGSEALTLPASFTANGITVDSYSIAPYAFHNRKDIYSVTVPAAVTFISHQAFEACTNLREVYNLSSLSITKGSYDHGQVAYYAYIVHTSTDAEPLSNVRIGDFEFYKSADSWFLVRYHGAGGDVILDSFTYEGEEIPSYEVLRSAFQGNGNITSLVITDAVKRMDPYAFQSMGSLQSVRFEDNTEMTVIPEYAFAWCYNLKQVTLPSTLTEIRYNAFWECQALREIYNLSSLELTMGASDHGYVAQYAFIIHDSLDDPALSEVRIGDYVFLNSGDVWLLERYDGTESDIVLGTFTHDGMTVNSYAIMTGAFRHNSYVERVVIGDEVKSIGREAFYNCSRLKSVSFADNTSITTILPHTFAYSRNLDTVILPVGLTSIEYDAFWECSNLWVVCNLSDLDLTIGSDNNGYVACYAKVILTSPDEDELRVMNVDQRGYTYKFYCENGEWSLYARVQYSGYDWQYILPELVIDGTVTPYRVATGISGYSQIVIPASVTYVDLNSFTGSEILYGGTAEEFAALTEGYNVSHYAVRYYADCVHNEEQWSYYPDGSIMMGMSYSSTVIKDATCTEKGIIQYTCSHCQETWEGETQSFGNHDMDEDHRCRICGVRFESRPLQDVWKVTNDPLYPFDITENGEIVSTNKGDFQVATITLEALYATVFTYDYYVSTEGGCDVLIVRKNGVDLTYASGTGADVQRGVTVDVAAGDVITVTYSKDGSVSTGEDLVKILNLVYFVEEAGDTFEK